MNNDNTLATIPEGQGTDLANLNMRQIFYLGEAMMNAGMFGETKNAAQAAAKIMAGQALGIDPITSLRGIYTIGTNFGFRSDLVAARVKAHPKYDYRILAHTDEKCIIQFYEIVNGRRTEIGQSEFTQDDARRQGTKNLDRFPKNMLLARAMTNGVKWYCPDVMMGMPMEGDQPIEAEVVEPDLTEARQKAAAAGQKGLKVEPESDTDEPETSPTVDDEPAPAAPHTPGQRRKIYAVLNELGFSNLEVEPIFKGLTGLDTMKDLTRQGADDLLMQLDIAEAGQLREMFLGGDDAAN